MADEVHIYMECDACGAKEEVPTEEEATQMARNHAAHCKKCHKGVHR